MDNNTKFVWSDDIDDMFGSEEQQLAYYNDYAEANELELKEKIDDDVIDCLNETNNIYLDDFLYEFGNVEVLAIADLGLWYGRRAGGRIGLLRDVICRTFEDYNTICYLPEEHCFEVKAVHHDGTNYFKIYALSTHGKRYIERHRMDSDREVHNHLLEHKKDLLKHIKY